MPGQPAGGTGQPAQTQERDRGLHPLPASLTDPFSEPEFFLHGAGRGLRIRTRRTLGTASSPRVSTQSQTGTKRRLRLPARLTRQLSPAARLSPCTGFAPRSRLTAGPRWAPRGSRNSQHTYARVPSAQGRTPCRQVQTEGKTPPASRSAGTRQSSVPAAGEIGVPSSPAPDPP